MPSADRRGFSPSAPNDPAGTPSLFYRNRGGTAGHGRGAPNPRIWRVKSSPSRPPVLPELLPGETEFVLLCWEGPDPYARVGGLGTRITGLSRALAEGGYRTHLVFVGDPDRPEREAEDRLHLYRLCQGLSRTHAGVYEGEEARLEEYGRLAPIVAWEAAIAPALAAGRRLQPQHLALAAAIGVVILCAVLLALASWWQRRYVDTDWVPGGAAAAPAPEAARS